MKLILSHREKLEQIPIVECELRQHYVGGLKFFCKYCKKYHLHGRGLGHRSAHCGADTPYKETGYILKLKAGEIEKFEKDLQPYLQEIYGGKS